MTDLDTIVAVDVFCGVGGLTFGLERVGVQVKLGIDIDPACRHPIEQNTRSSFLEADVGSLDSSVVKSAFEGAAISLLAGCAPCQPFSTYTRSVIREAREKGRGENHGDWQLVEQFGKLVEATQPHLVTMENVPPLEKQPVFESLLKCLQGYYLDYKVLECQSIGLPQTRKRLVLVASRLGPIEIPCGAAKPLTVREVIGELPPIPAGGRDPNDRLHRSSKLSALNIKRIRASVPGGTWRDWPSSLRASCHHKLTGATYPSVYGRMEWDKPSPTITTQCFGFGNGRFGHPDQDRAISLREAAMLQGFPREYSFVPDNEEISFAKVGRLIGNAVPVDLGAFIGNVLIDHVKKHRRESSEAQSIADNATRKAKGHWARVAR
jgi:DNA (cytosine-5)-methyltransferase 1